MKKNIALPSPKIKTKPGLGLIEVIAALGLSVTVLVALVSLSIFSTRSALQSTVLLNASKEANRQLELVRSFRDQTELKEAGGNIPMTWAAFTTAMGSCSNACRMVFCSYQGTGATCTANPTTGYVPYRSVYTPLANTAFGPETLEVYFKARNLSDGAVTSTDTTVRITVISKWRVSGDIKTNYLYSDLTNWQNK